MPNNALVSVIVPVYNSSAFILETIDTIYAQDYRPLEIIIVDDGSTDDSAKLIQRFPDIKYIYQNNQGPGAAKNTGIRAAQGEYLAFLDADDLWKPDKISRQIDNFLQNIQFEYSITHMHISLKPGMQKPAWLKSEFLHQNLPAYLPSSLMVKRELFQRIGLFDETLKTSEDVDWFFRAKDSGAAMAILPDVLLERRIHEKNLSGKIDALYATLFESVRRSLRRRDGRVD